MHTPRSAQNKRFFSYALILLLLLLFSLCACEMQNDIPAYKDGEDTEVALPDTVTVEYAVCKTGGGEIRGEAIQSGKPGEGKTTAVTAVAGVGYVFSGWSDGVTDATRTDLFPGADTTVYANFSFARLSMPIISIHTETGGDVESKEEYIGASFSLCNTGNADYERSGLGIEIRGRGNGTWSYPKKSYRIKFTYKQNLLGLGTDEHRSWILLANFVDRTMLRSYLAIDLANRLSGIDYNNNMAFVELYLNGEYRGVYVLAEQIEDDVARVNIGTESLSDPTVADAGFLVEMDAYAEEPELFHVMGQAFGIKNEILNEEQRNYIIDYISRVDEAIRRGKKEEIEALVDLDSLIDGYLLEEYFKNTDVGWSSFFMHKRPGEKMVFGPFWDFDLSAGSHRYVDNGAYTGLYVAKRTNFPQQHEWFIRLARQDWFTEAVRARYAEILPCINEMLSELDRVTEVYAESFLRNYTVWPIKDNNTWFQPDEMNQFTSWKEYVTHIRTWLTNRRDWMAEYMASDDAYKEFK